jgi:hypothetical protein
MMNYRTKIKAILEQATESNWEFRQACKPQNRKVFPFYCRLSLCSYKYIAGNSLVLDKVIYDDFQDHIYDASSYWGYVVWEDMRTVKFYEDFPKKYYPRLYDYHEQIYGWKEQITFGKTFECSIKHRAVWYCVLCYPSMRYFLNEFKNTGITESVYSKRIKETLHGASQWGTENDKGRFQYSSGRGLESETDSFEPYLTLSHTQIITIINEILYENCEHKQLSLF